jgi:hypothetical protein
MPSGHEDGKFLISRVKSAGVFSLTGGTKFSRWEAKLLKAPASIIVYRVV